MPAVAATQGREPHVRGADGSARVVAVFSPGRGWLDIEPATCNADWVRHIRAGGATAVMLSDGHDCWRAQTRSLRW